MQWYAATLDPAPTKGKGAVPKNGGPKRNFVPNFDLFEFDQIMSMVDAAKEKRLRKGEVAANEDDLPDALPACGGSGDLRGCVSCPAAFHDDCWQDGEECCGSCRSMLAKAAEGIVASVEYSSPHAYPKTRKITKLSYYYLNQRCVTARTRRGEPLLT